MNNWKQNLVSLIEQEKIRTDSDLEDFASSNRVSEEDVFHFVAILRTQHTSCEGCKYVDFYPNMTPCSRCTRSGYNKDYFEKEENQNDEN